MQSELLERARKQIERQLAAQEDEHRRALMKKRLEFVGQAIDAFGKKKMAEAVIGFRSYIKLLEDFKGVGEGGLTPANFDRDKELGDLLLLSGVYWELTKLFDRTTSEEKKKIFLHYMEKFVSFANGTTYQSLCAEGVRRYLAHGTPVHREAFKNAYKVLGKGKCFVVSSLIDVIDYETLPAFWSFRDGFLLDRWWGRALIRVYYFFGPAIAWFLDRMPARFRLLCGQLLDGIARSLN